MKAHTFIIGSTDDFETWEELLDYAVKEGYYGDLNYSIFEFDCPADCSEETVTMMGRGFAFSNDWAMDDTFSFLLNGGLEGTAEKEMFDAGVEARESQKESAQDETVQLELEFKSPRIRSEQQIVDIWNPNDPKHW